MTRVRRAALVAGAALVLLPVAASAHPKGQRPVITIVPTSGGLDVSWLVAADDMAAIGRTLGLGPLAPTSYAQEPRYERYLTEGLRFRGEDRTCTGHLVTVEEVPTGYASILEYDCGGPIDEVTMRVELLFELSTQYVHRFHATTASGIPVRGQVAASDRTVPIHLGAEPATSPTAVPEEDPTGRLEGFARGEDALGFAFALALAFGLGALHGLTPGHGKTLTVAYVAGAHGTIRDAALLAGVVAVAHGVSTWVLAMLASGIDKLAPERIVPWLEGATALLAAGIGIGLLRGRRHHTHADGEALPERPRLHRLVAIGLIGGLIPGPDAFAVGFLAAAEGEVARGIMVVAAFSIGLAAIVFAVAALAVVAGRKLVASHRLEHLAGRALGIVFLLVAILLAVRATGPN